MYEISTGTKPYDLMWLLAQVNEMVGSALSRQCHQLGVTVPAAQTLYMIEGVGKPVTAYKTAGLVGRQHHSVVELTNRMKTKGLVHRTSGEAGKSGLALTDEGKEILNKFIDIGVMDTLVGNMSKEDLAKLMVGLTALRDAAMKEVGELNKGKVELWQ